MSIRIDRREFLRLGLLAASAQLAPLRSWNFTPQALSHTTSPKKVWFSARVWPDWLPDMS